MGTKETGDIKRKETNEHVEEKEVVEAEDEGETCGE